MSVGEKKQPTGDYSVGYARPPDHTKFGKRFRDKRKPKSDAELAAAALHTPVKVNRDGRSSSIHPHEAALLSFVKRAFDVRATRASQFRAVKSYFKACDAAGMFNLPEQPLLSPVIHIPYGMDPSVVAALVRRYGHPPWPENEYDRINEEHRRDCEVVSELYRKYVLPLQEAEDARSK